MRSWRGINTTPITDAHLRRELEAMSRQLYELTSGVKKVADGYKPDQTKTPVPNRDAT